MLLHRQELKHTLSTITLYLVCPASITKYLSKMSNDVNCINPAPNLIASWWCKKRCSFFCWIDTTWSYWIHLRIQDQRIKTDLLFFKFFLHVLFFPYRSLLLFTNRPLFCGRIFPRVWQQLFVIFHPSQHTFNASHCIDFISSLTLAPRRWYHGVG